MKGTALPLLAAALAACAFPRPGDAWRLRSLGPSPAVVELPPLRGPVQVDLPTVLRLAMDRSLDLALASERARQAAAEEQIAWARFFPWVTVGGRFVGHDGLTQSTEGEFPDVRKRSAFTGVGPSLRWDLGDAVFAALAARQRREAGSIGVEAEERGGALKASEAYLDLVRTEATLHVSEDALALSETLLAETTARVEAGGGFAADTLRARAQAAHARMRVENAREARRRAALVLAEILDLPEEVELVPADPLPPRLALVSTLLSEEELMREAVASRPEVRQAALLTRAAGREESAARWGPLLPTVEAEASFGRLGPAFDDTDHSDDYRVAVGWRIGPGGLFDPGRGQLASSRARAAAIEEARVRGRVVREVREARAAVESRRAASDAADQALQDASAALDLYRERLRRGLGLPLEVVVAEDALVRARLDWIESSASLGKAEIALLAAVGGGELRAVAATGGAR